MDTRITYEPPIVAGTLSAAVAVAGVVLGAVSLIAVAFPPAWLPGWYRFAPLAFALFGVLLALRFTRDDRDIGGRIARLEMDCVDYEIELLAAEVLLEERDEEIATLTDDVAHYRGLIKDPPQYLTINDKNGRRIVPLYDRDQTWNDALRLVALTDDYGIVAGRDKSGLGREAQAAAVELLGQAKVIRTNGNISRLTVTRQAATDTLHHMAPATPPPPDEKLGQPSQVQEVEPNFVPSAGGSGEVAA